MRVEVQKLEGIPHMAYTWNTQTVRRIDSQVAEVSYKNKTSQPGYDSTFEQEKGLGGEGLGSNGGRGLCAMGSKN